ncbi:adenylate/guanylate cyclase domain-containing protein [Bradyrhizobium jicamae]|uniref:adenylate/guanylate cyclase domain-containing protein n=1 Tax=Bradyrhizobium jicamae TaxID=280332 RepID=UPI00289F8D4F|nr:adenylate/guanylate cyclase domain-containing protein [Bradyrhizobium jicamae]
MAADVVGYSRLMGLDEVGTARALREHRQITDALVAKHGGRLVKTTGDGVLLEFPSVVDAVECAVAMQAVMAERNQCVPEDRRMLYRIGINLGDILIEGDDILGDGVNVAARLEGIAQPGGICVASSAYEQVRGKVPVEFADLGEQRLKNIDRPVRVYAAKSEDLGMVAPVLHSEPTLLPLPDKPSIAVLPFQNMSGDPEQEYFADGVVEDIITALSRFKSLFVIARNSSFAYKGKSPDIRQVGRDLGVRYVLEGSVRRVGNRLRITAQLIDALTGAHVWADRFEGSAEDIFRLQDDVAEKVIIATAPRVERAEIARAWRRSSSNPDAYDYFWKALAYLAPATDKNTDQALELLSKATTLDPGFASAYAQAMVCHANRLSFGSIKDLAREQSEVARLWRIVALVGNDDGRALAGAGWAVAYMLRDLPSGKELIDRAVELNPNLVNAQASGGWISLWLGHPEIAVEQLSRAQRLDPVSTSFPIPMAHAYYFLERYEEALDQAQHFLQRHPDMHPALRIGAASAAFAGRDDVAHQLACRLLEVDPAFSVSRIGKYLGPYRRQEFVEKYAEGLRRAGLP